MTEPDNLIVGTAVAMIVIYLVGPSARLRITKAVAEWLLVILVLVWMI